MHAPRNNAKLSHNSQNNGVQTLFGLFYLCLIFVVAYFHPLSINDFFVCLFVFLCSLGGFYFLRRKDYWSLFFTSILTIIAAIILVTGLSGGQPAFVLPTPQELSVGTRLNPELLRETDDRTVGRPKPSSADVLNEIGLGDLDDEDVQVAVGSILSSNEFGFKNDFDLQNLHEYDERAAVVRATIESSLADPSWHIESERTSRTREIAVGDSTSSFEESGVQFFHHEAKTASPPFQLKQPEIMNQPTIFYGDSEEQSVSEEENGNEDLEMQVEDFEEPYSGPRRHSMSDFVRNVDWHSHVLSSHFSGQFEESNFGEYQLGDVMTVNVKEVSMTSGKLSGNFASFGDKVDLPGQLNQDCVGDSCNGDVEFQFECSEASKLELEMEVKTPNENSDSCSVQVDDSPISKWMLSVGKEMHWSRPSPVLEVAKGPHTLKIIGRQDGVEFRTLRMLKSTSCSFSVKKIEKEKGSKVYDTACFSKGSDMASRDAACTGNMVCAKKGEDGRNFGGCSADGKPSADPEKYCCSKPPSNMLAVVQENDNPEDYSMGSFGKAWAKIEKSCTGLLKLKADDVQDHYASNTGEVKKEYGARKLEAKECLPYTCEEGRVPVCMNTAKIDRAKYEGGYSDLCWCENPKRKIGFPPSGCECKERFHPTFGIKKAECDSSELDVTGFNSDDLWCYARGYCEGQMESKIVKENVVKCEGIQEGARIDLTSIGKYSFTGRRREIFSFEVPAENFLQGSKPLGAILIILNENLVPMARIDQTQLYFRVANPLEKTQKLTLLYIVPHLQKGDKWSIFAQTSKIQSHKVCSEVQDPKECLQTFDSRASWQSDCCLIDDYPESGKSQCEAFKKIKADGLAHKAVCAEVGYEATYNHQRMRNFDNKWIAALDNMEMSSIHYYQLPMFALFSDLNLKNPDELVMHAQTEKESEPWFFMGFQVPVTVGEINFRSPGPAAVTSTNVTSDNILRESEGMIVALGFEPCTEKGCPLNQAYICEHIIEDQMSNYYIVDCQGQVGKYVYWVLPGENRILKLADIVMDAKIFTKPGVQIRMENFPYETKVLADRYQGDPSFPLSGVVNPYSPKCVLAESSERPATWQVDLGSPTYIDVIRVYFYHNVYISRVPGFSVKVDGSSCTTNVDVGERTYVLEVKCNTHGQVLEISTPKNTPLVLCDVQMFLTPKPSCSHEVCAQCAPLEGRRRRNHCTKCHKNYILADNTCHFQGQLLRNDPQSIELPKELTYHSKWIVEFTLNSASKTNKGPLFSLMNDDSRLLSVEIKGEVVAASMKDTQGKTVRCEAPAPMGKELRIAIEYYKRNFNIVVNNLIKCHKQVKISSKVKSVSFKNGKDMEGTVRNLVYKPAGSGGVRLLGTGQYLVNKMSVAKFYRFVDLKQEFELKFDVYPVNFQKKRHIFRISPKQVKGRKGKGIDCYPCVDMVGPEQRLEISITDAYGLLKTCSPDQMIPTREYTSVRVELENKVMTVKYNGVSQCSVIVEPPQVPLDGVIRIGQHKKLKDALAFVSNIIYDDSSSEICPSGFQHVYGNCYRKSEKKLKWQEAREYCQKYGGDLATIHVDGQNLFLQNIYGGYANTMQKDLWIGVSSDNGDAEFAVGGESFQSRWVDDTPMMYVNFKDESSWDASMCTALQSKSGLWIQNSCDTPKEFVCSLPAICPPRFTLRGDKCVKFVNDRMTYDDAEDTCNAFDANLFQYDKYEEISLVNEFANKMQNGVWFGCYDDSRKNCFSKPKKKLLTEGSCYGKEVLVSVKRKKKTSGWSIGPCFDDKKSSAQHCCLPFGVHEVQCTAIDLSVGGQEFCQASMEESSGLKIYINEFSCPMIVVSTSGESHECSGLFKKTDRVSGGAAVFEAKSKMVVHRYEGKWYCGKSTSAEDNLMEFTFNKYAKVVGGRKKSEDEEWSVFPDLRVQCAPHHECNEAELYSSVFKDFNGVYKRNGDADGSALFTGDNGRLYWDAAGVWVAEKDSSKMSFRNVDYSFPSFGAHFDGKFDGNAVLNCATTCRDTPGWHDSEGDQYICDWYKDFNRCNLYGNDYAFMGKTAKQACCVCGGGQEEKSSAFVCGDKPSKASFCATPGMLCKGSICTSENEWQPDPDAKPEDSTEKTCDGDCGKKKKSKPNKEGEVSMSDCEKCQTSRRMLQLEYPCTNCDDAVGGATPTAPAPAPPAGTDAPKGTSAAAGTDAPKGTSAAAAGTDAPKGTAAPAAGKDAPAAKPGQQPAKVDTSKDMAAMWPGKKDNGPTGWPKGTPNPNEKPTAPPAAGKPFQALAPAPGAPSQVQPPPPPPDGELTYHKTGPSPGAPPANAEQMRNVKESAKDLHSQVKSVVSKIAEIKKQSASLLKMKKKKSKKKKRKKMSKKDLQDYMKLHEPKKLIDDIDRYRDLAGAAKEERDALRKKLLEEEKRRIRMKKRLDREKKFAAEVAQMKAHHKQTIKILKEGADNLDDVLDRINEQDKENMDDLEDQFDRSSRFIPKLKKPKKVMEQGCCKVQAPCCEMNKSCCQQSILCCKESKESKKARDIYNRIRKAKKKWKKEVKKLLKKMKKQHEEDMDLFEKGADGLRHIVKVMDSRHKRAIKQFFKDQQERKAERIELRKEQRERKAARDAERKKLDKERKELKKLRQTRRERRRKEFAKYAKMAAEHRDTIREFLEQQGVTRKNRDDRRKKRMKRRVKRQAVKGIVKKFVAMEEDGRQKEKAKDAEKAQEDADNSYEYTRKASANEGAPVEGKSAAKAQVQNLFKEGVPHVVKFDKTNSVEIDPKKLSDNSRARLELLKFFNGERPEEASFERRSDKPAKAGGPHGPSKRGEQAKIVDDLMHGKLRKVKGSSKRKGSLLHQIRQQAEDIHKLFLDEDEMKAEGKAKSARMQSKMKRKAKKAEKKAKKTIKKLKAGQKQLMDDVNELAKMKASPGSAEKVKALAKKVQKEAKSLQKSGRKIDKETKKVKRNTRESARLVKEGKDVEKAYKKFEKTDPTRPTVSKSREKRKMKKEADKLMKDLVTNVKKSVDKTVKKATKKDAKKSKKEMHAAYEKEKKEKMEKAKKKKKKDKKKKKKAEKKEKKKAEKKEKKKAEKKEKKKKEKAKAKKKEAEKKAPAKASSGGGGSSVPKSGNKPDQLFDYFKKDKAEFGHLRGDMKNSKKRGSSDAVKKGSSDAVKKAKKEVDKAKKKAKKEKKKAKKEKKKVKKKVDKLKQKAKRKVKSLEKKMKKKVQEKVQKAMKKKLKAKAKKMKKKLKKIVKKAAKKVKSGSGEKKSPKQLAKKLKKLEKEKAKTKKKIVKTAGKALDTSSNKKAKKLTSKANKLESKKDKVKSKIRKVKRQLKKEIKKTAKKKDKKEANKAKKKDADTAKSAARKKIEKSLLRIHREMTAKADAFVEKFSLDPDGRDKALHEASEKVEKKLEKLYKRVSNRKSIPIDGGAKKSDPNKKFSKFENEEKKRLKDYIKGKLGGLDRQQKNSVKIKGSAENAEEFYGGTPVKISVKSGAGDKAVAEYAPWADSLFESDLDELAVGSSLWDRILEAKDGFALYPDEFSVSKKKDGKKKDAKKKSKKLKKSKTWQEATDKFIKQLEIASKQIDSLADKYVLIKAAEKKKKQRAKEKGAKKAKKKKADKKKKDIKRAQKNAKKAKKAVKKGMKKMKKVMEKEKKKLAKEAKAMEKKLLKKAKKKVKKAAKKLKKDIKKAKQKGLEGVYAPDMAKMGAGAKKYEKRLKRAEKKEKRAEKSLEKKKKALAKAEAKSVKKAQKKIDKKLKKAAKEAAKDLKAATKATKAQKDKLKKKVKKAQKKAKKEMKKAAKKAAKKKKKLEKKMKKAIKKAEKKGKKAAKKAAKDAKKAAKDAKKKGKKSGGKKTKAGGKKGDKKSRKGTDKAAKGSKTEGGSVSKDVFKYFERKKRKKGDEFGSKRGEEG